MTKKKKKKAEARRDWVHSKSRNWHPKDQNPLHRVCDWDMIEESAVGLNHLIVVLVVCLI